MRVVVTGANGFLGWHLRIRLKALTDHEFVGVDVADWDRLPELLAAADAVIHLAGINRASDDELLNGNRQLAAQLVAAAEAAAVRPTVIYANSIQADNDSPYGQGKAAAAAVLSEASARWGTTFVDVLLPNLFGEHGRPGYNSFVATFADKVIRGEAMDVQDRPIDLLHAQDAAQVFIDALQTEHSGMVRPQGHPTSVVAVKEALERFHASYRTGEIPSLADGFELALFNTYRAARFPVGTPIALTLNSDPRGWLVETVRWAGGEGQTFVSSTVPGISRGNHYHLRKIERFVVVAGQARISLRKVGTTDVLDFDVSGEVPVAIDMPIGWAHSITNTGEGELLTQFWVNERFNPADSDTHPLAVLDLEA